MANLDGYNAEDHKPMDSYEAIPKGDYPAVATDSDIKPNSKGTGSYLEIVWELIDGDHKGRKLWSRLNLDNPNQTAVEIAQRELSSICRAVGVLRPKDSAQLHGIPIILKIGVEKRKDTGELTNRIRGYEAMEGAQVKKPASDGPTKPPWKR